MKLLTVEIEGLGPFAGRQRIEFEPLNQAGLFLLSGPTGAGKTSVLDSICLALYGAAPGHRDGRPDLVSHHRGADTVPRVELEATIGERRIKVRRSPAYLRPKKRGDGVTEEAATAELFEWRDEAWAPVSARVREVDDTVRGWLGMDRDQFAQVVALPQGEFARFLRSDAGSRRKLLERLFPTHDFSQVESWLRDNARRARDQESEQRHAVDRVIAAAAAVAGDAAGPGGELPSPDETEAVAEWARAVAMRLGKVRQQAETELERIGGEARRAEELHRQVQARLERIVECEAEVTAAGDRHRRLLEEAAAAGEPSRERERRLRAEAATLVELERDVAERRAQLTWELTEIESKVKRSEAARAEAVEAVVDGPEKIAELEAAVGAAAESRSALPGARAESERLVGRAAAAEELAQLQPAIERAEQEAVDSRAKAMDAEQRWLDVREARLDGYAAELAADLKQDQPCPVCGAEHHPRRAVPRDGAPTKSDEDGAKQLRDTAKRVSDGAEQERDQHRRRAGLLRHQAGEGEPGQLRQSATDAAKRSDRLQAEADDEKRRQAGLKQLRAKIDGAEARRATAERELEAAREGRKHIERELDRLREREDAARGDDASVAERRIRIEALAERVDQVVEAERELADVKQALAAARQQPDPAEPEAAKAEFERLAEARERCASRHTEAAARDQDFRRETAELADLLERLGPLIEEARRAGNIADLARGRNPARLELSIFVLAARLQQVIEAANTRLGPMSAGRYELVYSAQKPSGNAKSGLGIRVFDGHTGTERETGSLSGGESFYVSLALALGLAEVVQRESGGRRLETLFIDEGFGTLDSETLDQVMAVLDELREGGRAVGVVSHVEELKNRIPAQIEIRRTPNGSTAKLSGVHVVASGDG